MMFESGTLDGKGRMEDLFFNVYQYFENSAENSNVDNHDLGRMSKVN